MAITSWSNITPGCFADPLRPPCLPVKMQIEQAVAPLEAVGIDLGLKDIRVLTNHPKKVVALEGYGIRIADQVPLKVESPEAARRATHQTL